MLIYKYLDDDVVLVPKIEVSLLLDSLLQGDIHLYVFVLMMIYFDGNLQDFPLKKIKIFIGVKFIQFSFKVQVLYEF